MRRRRGSRGAVGPRRLRPLLPLCKTWWQGARIYISGTWRSPNERARLDVSELLPRVESKAIELGTVFLRPCRPTPVRSQRLLELPK